MKEKIKNFIFENYLLITFLSFTIVFFSFFPFFRYQINPDGISLINIAKKYLSGNFKLAINGYWSPLISFLLVPFIMIFKDGILSFKILSFLIGLFSIFSFDRFLKKLNILSDYRKIFFIFIIPFVTTHFSLITMTSDFITATFFLFSLSFFVDEQFFNKKYSFLILGFVGFLTYLSKTYGFFFFIGFIFFLFTVYLIKKDFVKVKNIFFTGLIFTFLSSFWIILISSKYGYFTIGTTGKYNYSLLTIDTLNLKKVYSQPLQPPDTLSTSFWDDPSFVKHPDFKIYMVFENPNYYLKTILERFLRTIRLIFSFSIFVPLIFIFSLTFLFKEERLKILIILLASLFSFIGYIPVEIERRYILINFYLTVSLFLIVLESLKTKENIKSMIFILIALSFLIMPLKELKSDLNYGKEVYQLSKELKKFNISGNVASNSQRKNTTYISYYLDLRYFGVFYYNDDENKFFDDLAKNKISYYFYYGKASSFFDKTKLLYNGFIDGESLKIYKVNE
uniref:Glycosyltransferase RgtA/B/C/D-like domain-containing protein n=1 Tax=candidate division WOR-3 bacterium TaxID=2052148 RepID=A0A7C3NFW2_UNCW3